MASVLVTAAIPKSALAILKEAGLEIDVYTGSGLITKEELVKRIVGKDYLITPLSTQVDKDVINADPGLKIIANYGAGFNNIDAAYARQKGIPVTNTPEVSTVSTAEVTTGLMITLAHRMVEGDKLMRTKGFDGWSPLFFLGHELSGKTLGIVGMGQIGQAVAKRMRAFDMNIIYSQRTRLDPKVEAQFDAKFVSLKELIQTSDVLSLHCPLNDATHHMIGAPEFKQMKSSAYLINAARGPVIDEAALLEALKAGELAGAALDVYEAEPNVDDGFKALDNVILTPHVGNATVEARDAMAAIVAKNTVRIDQGQEPLHIVN
ncbi:2-hydroxyacid dehydrogenase family protein [Levilactobacillus parabrevis]|uniref:Lactate dehydrogenase related enzyme n=1 Tax=Levilactobacillus parabrevis ATCC 53295 TaxID=1267003 RepID=A0A0R1H1L5_9LACO|nr:2-hydroxyacid dehydrogenase family protein [Levilactobacillus parabrevis]KRK37250.1 lactate dehydrogenase related enzyme [Levilactobacillus parabrevis ATCC 53295]KRO06254.1 lactate dehydrogenase related enzyme [Levilactobacillus parabrevis]MCT4486805.1 hydroxyacid dehydrogenase [Levilactobacillus parabrevis]MCT4489272.1 hydroxyacid dehydrogenase [Levilactobacillus parabrevis]